MGEWNKGDGPVNMYLGQEIAWLTGQKLTPWVFELELEQKDIKRITYKYSIRCEEKDYSIWEREPSRYIEV